MIDNIGDIGSAKAGEKGDAKDGDATSGGAAASVATARPEPKQKPTQPWRHDPDSLDELLLLDGSRPSEWSARQLGIGLGLGLSSELGTGVLDLVVTGLDGEDEKGKAAAKEVEAKEVETVTKRPAQQRSDEKMAKIKAALGIGLPLVAPIRRSRSDGSGTPSSPSSSSSVAGDNGTMSQQDCWSKHAKRKVFLAGDRVRVRTCGGRRLDAPEEAVVVGAYRGRLWYVTVTHDQSTPSVTQTPARTANAGQATAGSWRRDTMRRQRAALVASIAAAAGIAGVADDAESSGGAGGDGGATGAWYWEREDAEGLELIERASISLLGDEDTGSESKEETKLEEEPEEQKVEEDVGDGDNGGDNGGDDGGTDADDSSLDAFCRLASGECWSIGADALLVHSLNQLCSEAGVDTVNLPCAALDDCAAVRGTLDSGNSALGDHTDAGAAQAGQEAVAGVGEASPTTVEALLEKLKLLQYHEKLISEGYEVIDDLKHARLEDLMDDCGLKKPHAKRIRTHFDGRVKPTAPAAVSAAHRNLAALVAAGSGSSASGSGAANAADGIDNEGIGGQQLLARAALLLTFNLRLSRCLPMVQLVHRGGMGMSDLVTVVGMGEGGMGDDPAGSGSNVDDGRGKVVGAGSSLWRWRRVTTGRRLRSLRQLVLARTKHALWRSLLQATTTVTPLPQDEYEDPKDIKAIRVNRIKANPSKLALLKQPAQRLRASIFGQLHRELRGWPDHAFRR
jgi:hypothetical protein